MEKTARKVEKLVFGAGVGLANSLFGGGGGMLAVPALMRAGLEEKRAHATAILLVLPVSVSSFLFYAFEGLYDPSVLLPTAIGVSLGGLFGAKLLGKLQSAAVRKIFALLQLAAGASLLFFR